jgi:hypothetical protein
MMFSGRHFSLAEYAQPPHKPFEMQFLVKNGGIPIYSERLRRFMRRCPNGMFVSCHAAFHDDLLEIVRDLNFRHILVVRDPRDIVLSYTFFVIKERWTRHHYYYTKVLKTKAERLMATILGFPGDGGIKIRPLASIGVALQGYLRWISDKNLLVCRYEDLVGEAGGGTWERQLLAIRNISEFINRPLSDEATESIIKKMYSSKSLTFRKGMIGDWQNHFTDELKAVFKNVASDILIELGYESNSSW